MTTLEVTTSAGNETRILSLRVTAEQEIAIYAFFQINGWTIITEEVPKNCSVCQRAINGEGPEEVKCSSCQKVIVAEQTTVEEHTGESTIEIQHVPVPVSETVTETQVQKELQSKNEATVMSVQEVDGRKVVLLGNTKPQANIQSAQIISGQIGSEALIIDQNGQQQIIPLQPEKHIEPTPPKIYNVNNSSDNRPFKCEDCGKHFRKKTHVLAHMKFHSGEALPKCEICGKEFLYKHNLISHMSIHSGERPYQCNVCTKAFRRKDDLQIHMRTHTGERPYKCDICGKAFTTQNQLPKHRRTHTGEKPYQCPICQKCFRTKPHLEKHNRTHSGERPFSCEECGRAFTQNAHLIAHMRIHTGEKPFKCDECDKAFKEMKTLRKHKLIHANGMPYTCHICGKGFLRQQNLEVHMCVHSDDEPKYKRRLRERRELIEQMRREEEQDTDSQRIVVSERPLIEEEVATVTVENMEISKESEQAQRAINGNIEEETETANSIASSLLTLVEMITSAENDSNQGNEARQTQVQGDVTTRSVNSTETVHTVPSTQNILIQQPDGTFQEGHRVITQVNEGELGESENIIITQVDTNEQHIIESVTDHFGNEHTYVVQYVEEA
ncbi:hypothetical protein FSP39_008407 [Pinctada imbricata]|uniref:C2H2-type domain-containing protein n=1 Tax=Pinctada imbricata TaxID=66713 RepID=A0AA88YN44_PINIB|nr:hypothetical protein FSP39_008407 [Pinctada imbricata]